MSEEPRWTRRDFGLALLMLGAGPGLAQAPRDQGIGGTGAAPKPSDRGIGGTGVIGTIRRFGSIYVNNLRISYADDVAVTIDGAPARASDMKIGHVARTIATGADSALSTRRIEIESEVVGPVQSLGKDSAVVLGQTIDLRAIKGARALKVGDTVAVFGQRRPNGIVVASLVEPSRRATPRLSGPVLATADGRASLGGLLLRGVPASFAGSRVTMEGRVVGDEMIVTSYRSVARPFGAQVQRVSIEAYTDRAGRLGSGYAATGRAAGGGGLSIVDGRVGASGAVVIEGLRPDRSGLPEAGGPAPLRAPNLLPGDRGGGLPLPGGGNGLPTLPRAPGLDGGGMGGLPVSPGGALNSVPNLAPNVVPNVPGLGGSGLGGLGGRR